MVSIAAASAVVNGQQAPAVQLPQPGVPQITTLEGNFVRVACNNEGYVVLGYQMAQRSQQEHWLMLEIGMTLMEKVKPQTLTRDEGDLNVRFEQSLARVPFRIFTPEAEKLVSKNFQSIEEQVENQFKKKD